jgi:sarcosine oxidase subunit gamma
MAEARTAERRSPLRHRAAIAAAGGALRIAEAPFIGKLILRGAPAAVADAVQGALGLPLPDALSSTATGDAAALWLGPDEWMIVSAEAQAAEVSAKAAAGLAGRHHQVVDVGDYYTVVEARGEKARPALMKLTTLDLHPRAFRPGMVAGSVFGRANATVWLRQDQEEAGVFWLFIRWSMADYLWCALADAGREWGLPQQIPIKGERLTIG